MNDFTVLSGLNPDDYPSHRATVAMSGGVDSSLAAILLKEAGFEVIGLTMNLWDNECTGGPDDEREGCNHSRFHDARTIADSAGIPHYTINLREEFERIVVENFVSEYLSGRTPNPCVLCNKAVKWSILAEKARSLGFELFVTGHYARIASHSDGTYSLLAGKDRKKDQSYFLWRLDSQNLATTLFPLGAMSKEETRAEALKRNLKTAHRSESQEICFVPSNDYGCFIRHRFRDELPLPLTTGDILDASGSVIGKHKGAAYYTIGQRKGLGIALGQPVYVNAVDAAANTITVGNNEDLKSGAMTVGQIKWVRGFPPGNLFGCQTRIRHQHRAVLSEVRLSDGNAVVTFETPQRAVTPGQSAVFYDGDRVLGGGVIEKG